jgi:hypothetical protein
MVAEEAFDDWKKQRTAERSAAKQKQQSPEKVCESGEALLCFAFASGALPRSGEFILFYF